ncbi:MAG: hypothetical protein HY902_19335 [Deltaproteobacteria bacterium]|nr:hypothetical protein [Deltaproteobacteria bacterium]
MNSIAVCLLIALAATAYAPATAVSASALPAVGTRQPVQHPPQTRQKLCDFAVQASRAQALPMDQDPVFRAPPAEAKAALGVLRKDLMAGQPEVVAAAERQLAELLHGPHGPTLARLAMLDRTPAVQLAGIRAALPLASQHPRLFAFLPTLDAKTPPALARAVVAFNFATHCDAPVLFSLDGLEHPDPAVVADLIDRTAALAGHLRDAAPIDRLVAWLMRRQGPPVLRARAVRALGHLGLVKLSNVWQQLAGDASPEVAAEAWPAWAQVAPGAAQVGLSAGGFADSRPLLSWGALRAAADACALVPDRCDRAVRGYLGSKVAVIDPISGEKVQLSRVAEQVLRYWSVAGE